MRRAKVCLVILFMLLNWPCNAQSNDKEISQEEQDIIENLDLFEEWEFWEESDLSLLENYEDIENVEEGEKNEP